MKYLQNLFSGRLNRINFWIGLLFIFLVFPAVLSLLNEFGIFSSSIIEWIPLVFITLFSLSITIRRLHDDDRSGWYIFWLFIPIFNLLFPILLVSRKGTVGINKYGDEDKGYSIKKILTG